MPQEITKHKDVLAAIERTGAISDLTAMSDGHYEYELDLEVIVYGRNYNGKRVGPYVRLLNYDPGEVIVREGDWGGNSCFIVGSGLAEVYAGNNGKQNKVSEIPEGVQFGEMSVLAGVQRAATVCAPANAPVQVLEVQRPALRLLRKLPRFGEVLDRTYRRNGRSSVIQTIKAATQLSQSAITQLEAISKFRIYSKNHILFRAGEPIRNLYIIRSGWARLAPADFHPSEAPEDEPVEARRDWTRSAEEVYIGQSHCLGAEAITRDSNWDSTCTLLGRTDVLEISVAKLRQYPELRETLLLAFSDLVSPHDAAHNRQPLPVAKAQEDLIETGLVDATNLLVMDMDLCVRCGNCSLACHKTHGESRLLRRGIHIERPVSMKKNASFQSLLAPSVCMHCKDPECLTGCPTGAIGRFPGGQVDIDPKSCIGCADCATQCPYNAISMTPRKGIAFEVQSSWWKKWFGLSTGKLPPAVDQTEDLLAVKCNLCAGTPLNEGRHQRHAYSCEENCPTGSLLRVDPRVYFSEIRNIEGVIFRDGTHALVLHTSHRDAGKRMAHLLGIALTVVLTALAVLGLFEYGLEKALVGSWLDLRWLTGIVGLAGIAGVMAYPVRRQIYKRRGGPLRYWMLAHSYLGVIAGIMLLLHGGTRSGGVLTTSLMVSFDLVILTGLFGILVYLVAPRIMTRIEGQPLLIEDLTERRNELSRKIGEEMASATPNARMYIQKQVIPRTCSLGFLFRQYLKVEPLERMMENVKSEYAHKVAELPEKDRAGILGAVETAVTLRRVDALIYLHQMLKLWLAPHVLFTSLMLALMIVHIIQVIFFADFS